MGQKSKRGFIAEELDRLESLHQRRSLKRLEARGASDLFFQGKRLINFSSNDYLGLSEDERVKRAAKAAIDQYHASAASSRLICGNLDVHEQLEKELAAFKEKESALVFSSGYMTNIGLISALAGKEDEIYSDELNHASIIDGCRLSQARIRIFQHRDLDHLESLLRFSMATGRRLIVSDSVFSMDGDLAELPGLVDLAEKYDALLVLDEAHATGVLGSRGRGVYEHFADLGLMERRQGSIDVAMGTLSKALGSFGGFVACSRSMRDFLINKCRSFIFSTALPPSAVGAARASLNIVQQDRGLREKLWRNTNVLKKKLQERGFDMGPSETPILPIRFGSELKALTISAGLLEMGFYVPAIRPPSVPSGTSRLRLTVTAAHSEAQIEALVQALDCLRAREEQSADEG